MQWSCVCVCFCVHDNELVNTPGRLKKTRLIYTHNTPPGLKDRISQKRSRKIRSKREESDEREIHQRREWRKKDGTKTGDGVRCELTKGWQTGGNIITDDGWWRNEMRVERERNRWDQTKRDEQWNVDEKDEEEKPGRRQKNPQLLTRGLWTNSCFQPVNHPLLLRLFLEILFTNHPEWWSHFKLTTGRSSGFKAFLIWFYSFKHSKIFILLWEKYMDI